MSHIENPGGAEGSTAIDEDNKVAVEDAQSEADSSIEAKSTESQPYLHCAEIRESVRTLVVPNGRFEPTY